MFEAIIFSKSHRLKFQTSSAVCSEYIVISSPFSENKPRSAEKVNFATFPACDFSAALRPWPDDAEHAAAFFFIIISK